MGKNATIVAFRDEDLVRFDQDFTSVTVDDIEDLPVWLGPRQFLETYPAFRQLIPYVVIKKDDEYLYYRRAIAGNEERLHGNISIGIGGHVDAEDIWWDNEGTVKPLQTLFISALREIKEEIGINVPKEELKIAGVIRANHNDVDKHHLAVVVVCDISDTVVGNLTFEDTMDEIKFGSLEEIMNSEVAKETWTTLTIQALLDVNKFIDPDDAPEITEAWFETATLNKGGEVIRDPQL